MQLQFKKLCQRCGGSGQLLRPTKKRLLTFKRCTTCGGKGIRFAVIDNI